MKRASRGDCTLLSVCQAISIAITTVLPDTGRHLQRRTREAVVVGIVLRFEPLAPVGVAVRAAGDLGQEDRGLGGLALRRR